MTAPVPVSDEQAEVRAIVQEWEDHAGVLEPFWAASKRELDFNLKLAHYKPGQKESLERENRVAPVTLDLYDQTRFKVAEIAGDEPYIQAMPSAPANVTDPTPEAPSSGDEPKGTDPRWAKWALEHDLFDPECGFERVTRRVLMAGIAARAGAAMLGWDPELGDSGRIYCFSVNPSDIVWDTDFLHPHDPGNKLMIYRARVPFGKLASMGLKNLDLVVPDNEVNEKGESAVPVKPDYLRDRQRVTLYFVYRKDANQLAYAVQPDGSGPLAPNDQYLLCPNCGRTDQSGGQPAETAPCPGCGRSSTLEPRATMMRVEAGGPIVGTPRYRKGKKFCVIAPRCQRAGYLAEGGWPGDPPMFPVLYFVPNIHPYEHMGVSDTYLQSDMQAIKDAAFRQGFEQIQRNRDILIARLKGLKDASGEPYQFDGSGDYAAFVEDERPLNDLVQHFQGSGLSAALPTWVQMVDQTMRQNRGIGQLGISPDQLKGTQVGTAQQFIESGDVPVDDVRKNWRYELTIMVNNWHAMQRKLWTLPAWIGYLGQAGARAFKEMRGEDIPGARLLVTARPTMRAADADMVDRLAKLRGLSPVEARIVGQSAGLPEEWLNELQQERAAMTGMLNGGGGGAVPGPGGPPPAGVNGVMPRPQVAAALNGG